MTVKTGAAWSGLIVCLDSTGALSTPSVGPVGALYVDGTVNAASVTVTGTNPYKWTVTLPALTAGQRVSLYVTATIATIATAAIVAEESADTVLASDVKGDTAAILVDTGTTIDDLVDDLETRLTATRAGYLDNLANVTAGNVTVSSPVSADATLLTIVRGDDYDLDEERSLDFSGTDWPVLTSATITLTIRYSGRLVCTATGSVVTGTGTTKTVRVELTSAQTSLFAIGTRIYDFDVQATLPTTARKVTLARGKVTVLEDYTI